MRASFLPLLALLATGCERMPEDPIFLYGQVKHPDGSPASGTALHVDRALDSFDHLPGGSGYLEGRVWKYEPFSEGATEASGNFTLSVLSGDLSNEAASESYYGILQHRFRVYPPLEADGSGVFVAFIADDDVELPPLQPWASGLTVGDGPSLTFAAAPPAPELPPSATLPMYLSENTGESVSAPPSTPEPVVQLVGRDGLIWQQVQATSPWTPSPYVLEDFAGVEAQVRAASGGQWYFEPLVAEPSTLTFRLEWRSPRVGLPGGALRPVSRNAPCSPTPVDRPCPYTDGKLEAVLTRPMVEGAPQAPGVESLTFTLDAPRRLRRLVVRNLETTLDSDARMRVVLEGSVDGGEWATLGSFVHENHAEDPSRIILDFSLRDTGSDSPFDGKMELLTPPAFLDVPLPQELPVRYVRLSVAPEEGTWRGRLWKLSEVSLFE
ncbi:hypothetical protein JY651_43695 [Pyxidicoccus parkwayensis]|uniref:Lipoprotein n=1 Tax=Pyxidicoccus parkwayensis TaxID=2813578 RepID=A0ABX7NTD3_9BACT|nr:hypothetical protein [Pyxidicoccus parkwaysis]QSQ21978.1 hypothetical protein JY651_43695 [Pyxidicoccus parkwaysis]